MNICAVVISKHFPPQIVPLFHTLDSHEHKGVMSIPVDINYDLINASRDPMTVLDTVVL